MRHAITIADEKNEKMNIAQRMEFYKTSAVSIAIINDGKLAWAKGYGSISFDSQDKKVDTRTLFQAGSISKSITAMGALLLVQQGKLSLDKDVNNYLKSWKVPENEFTKIEKVTLRRLLSHSAGTSVSGFPGYPVPDYIPTTVEILKGEKPSANTDPVQVIQIPGKNFSYSGGGTTIVQLLIEDVTGEKFDTWMHKNILVPFGMTSSTFNQILSKEYSERAAWGHNETGKQVCGKWHIHPEMAPAGLWTTPTDLAQFLITILNILHGKQNGLINQELVKEAIKQQIVLDNETNKVGLGFFLSGSEQNISFGHGGCNEGFLSNMKVYPEIGKGWVIMTNNHNAGELINEIEFSIADTYKIPGF
ncbi:MAG: serine hydrolase [Candidatus Babeliales bacterium]|nr:serine hydrolase [Candidatus Babeliales bacterium]